MTDTEVGKRVYKLAEKLFPLFRHLMGDEVRESLQILANYIFDGTNVEMRIEEVPSGTNVFDWTIPDEWIVHDAYIETEEGKRIIDIKDNNLYIVSYSAPIDQWVSKERLLSHIYVQEEQPDVIPYVTSYYQRRSGFCMKKSMRDSLPDIRYHMVINSEFKHGSLTFGEVYLRGLSKKEILFSTYICHPSMANDNCSGMALQAELIRYASSICNRRYSYRFVFVPETIGSITYINRHLDVLKENVIAGFNLSCIGDDGVISIIHTRTGNTLADRVTSHLCKTLDWSCEEYPYMDRGSDERQYSSPRVNLPVVNISRSIFGHFPEYHTSADNMEYITPDGFARSFDFIKKIVTILENNRYYQVTVFCEPQLGKRGLYPTLGQKGNATERDLIYQLVGFADGSMDLIEIGEKIGCAADKLVDAAEVLLGVGLLVSIDEKEGQL